MLSACKGGPTSKINIGVLTPTDVSTDVYSDEVCFVVLLANPLPPRWHKASTDSRDEFDDVLNIGSVLDTIRSECERTDARIVETTKTS